MARTNDDYAYLIEEYGMHGYPLTDIQNEIANSMRCDVLEKMMNLLLETKCVAHIYLDQHYCQTSIITTP